ncbi:Type VI secretion system, phage-baseplate injector [Hyphomicrobium sp. 1Nfss2.1]|uniref:hypothetical protein n=1 Tax=Hyphomicrobium sp. 1Nfss2.1 TaxID=3413936 RepID=UPI003C7BC515
MSHLEERFRAIERQIANAIRDTEDTQRRLFNVVRFAKVSQVDHKNYRIKAIYAKKPDGSPVETPWIRWSTRSGKIKEWSPPSIGEQIMMISPSGNIGVSSWGAPGGFSNSNKQNHDQDGQYKLSVGDTSITVKDGEVLINTKKFRVETPGGKVEFDNKSPGEPEPSGVPLWTIPMSGGNDIPTS